MTPYLIMLYIVTDLHFWGDFLCVAPVHIRDNKSSPNCYPMSPWILNKIL
ncbi:protein of unknown function [Candidatus Nitrosotalea okcheonensis]|uniref:Uncharacterized protein n=1 Tax=Candidatus Nitrosotalea okcheonensis TaxID=1903276 RepID=A0A2H1FIH5_9ARCH|nr:protein of unknown function [Candidatus Nitrosotalea okcheonensis]